MTDAEFIKNLDAHSWINEEIQQARRLLREGKLLYVSGNGYGRYIKPENVKPWHEVVDVLDPILVLEIY